MLPPLIDYFLFFEKAGLPLDYGNTIYRNELTSASFNLNYDAFGYVIPEGIYFMALWVDDLEQVRESNEINNSSFSWDFINTHKSFYRKDYLNDNLAEAYNGRDINRIDRIQRSIVEIKDEKFRIIGNINLKSQSPTNKDIFFDKSIESKTKIIYPFLGKYLMN